MQNTFWQSGSDSRWFLSERIEEEKNVNGTRDPRPLQMPLKISILFFEPFPFRECVCQKFWWLQFLCVKGEHKWVFNIYHCLRLTLWDITQRDGVCRDHLYIPRLSDWPFVRLTDPPSPFTPFIFLPTSTTRFVRLLISFFGDHSEQTQIYFGYFF